MSKLLSGLVCLFSLCTSYLCGEPKAPFTLLTIPKSGSHLTIKALHLMTGTTPIWHTHFPSLYYIPFENGFLYTHLCLSPELERNYEDLPLLKKIINIRDLRDVCLSMIHQIEKNPWPGMSMDTRQQFKQMSFEEKLSFVINYDYNTQEVASFAPNSLQVSIRQVAEQALFYSMDPKNLVCRYENLVGPLGGGSEEAQRAELNQIAAYLGLSIPEYQIASIADRLYGDEENPFHPFGIPRLHSTFSRGKIGSWKLYFTEDHKRCFKEKLGDLLIALGYEEDNSW